MRVLTHIRKSYNTSAENEVDCPVSNGSILTKKKKKKMFSPSSPNVPALIFKEHIVET